MDVRAIAASIAYYRVEVAVARLLVAARPRKPVMTPKFRGVTDALKKLQHNLDADASKLLERIESADARRDTVFKKSQDTVAAAHGTLDGIDSFIDELERTNAGPLEDAPRSSEVARRQG